jgi:hypothetical protein
MPSALPRHLAAAVVAAALAGAAAPAAAQLLVVEARVPGQPEVSAANYAAVADALDKLKGVKVVPVATMKTAVATATPTLHLLEAAKLKILGDKVTAAYALAGGADPNRAIELAKEVQTQLLLATVAGGEAETRAVYFGCVAALAEAYRNLGRTADATAALREAALYVSEYEVTPDVYPAPLVDLYNRARSELGASKGTIEITASMPDAELTVDGISAGRGSFTGDLPRGEHYAYAKAGRASSAMMRFAVGSTRSALRLELVDPDLVRFAPNPYVTYASVSDRSLREPELAATLLRRGGATGAAFLSFDGTNLEVRVYDTDGTLVGRDSAKPKGGAVADLAERLAPNVPKTVKAAAAAGSGTGSGTGLGDGRIGDLGGSGTGTGTGTGTGDGTGAGTGSGKGTGSGAAKSGKLGTPLFFTAAGAAGVGLIAAIAFGAAGQVTESHVSMRLAYSGFYDYDSRLRMRATGRAFNVVAVLGLLVAIGAGAATVAMAVSGGGKKKKSPPADATASGGATPPERLKLGVGFGPDGLLVEF